MSTSPTDEYLTNLMDSDTMLTLENTNDAIKRAEKHMQRHDTDGEMRVAFSGAVDDHQCCHHDEVKTLRAALKEKDQRPAFRTSPQVPVGT